MSKNPKVAKIDESICIGCAKCLHVCPFDAILGANKQMHVVLEELCIGCDLCIPPCPVDAISLINVELPLSSQERAQGAKKRLKARKLRLAQIEKQKIAHDVNIIDNMQNLITESIKRARQKTSEKFPWNSHES